MRALLSQTSGYDLGLGKLFALPTIGGNVTGPLEFAVVDVETTGVLPERYDRIIEIAVVRAREDGTVVDEYCTLVNPNRDVGSTRLHGISAGDLRNAPPFGEIVGDVVSRLAGAVFVGHNVDFDWRFVQYECEQVGVDIPECPTLCTMQVARRADPNIPGRNLRRVCEHFGIATDGAHTAHADARASLGVLLHCLPKIRDIDALQHARSRAAADKWPNVPRSGKSYVRTDAAVDAARQQSFLAELIAELPSASTTTPEVHDYLALLDRVLEDRRVTGDEFDLMLAQATLLGLIQEQVREAHETYLRDLIGVALADRVLSNAEIADLEHVRGMLCIEPARFQQMMQDAKSSGTSQRAKTPATAADLEGKSICFTGELQCTIQGEPIERSFAEQTATKLGMIIKAGVSKKLDFLVTADPDSMSGKAKKAREYGTRILAEPVFWQMVGVTVD